MSLKLGGITVEMQAELSRWQSDMNKAVQINKRASDDIKKNLDGVQRSFAALAGVGAGITVGSVLKIADEYQVLQQRIKTATKATQDYATVSKDLMKISNNTGAALKESVQLFQGLSRSARELNATNADMLKLTSTVEKLGVIGGSTSVEMAQGLRQFSQAMAMGQVHAEEWNSIMENIPEVGNRIAAGLGLSVGQMKALMKEGKILSKDVFDSLLKQSSEIDREFAKMPVSMQRATQKFQNSISESIGTLDMQLGVTKSVAEALDFAADNAARLTNAVLGVGAGAAIFTVLRNGANWATAAVGALNAVMLANPYLRVASTIGVVTAAIIACKDEMVTLGDTTKTVGKWMTDTWKSLELGGKYLREFNSLYERLRGVGKEGEQQFRIGAPKPFWGIEAATTLQRMVELQKEYNEAVNGKGISIGFADHSGQPNFDSSKQDEVNKKLETQRQRAQDILADMKAQVLELHKQLAGREKEIPLMRALADLQKLTLISDKERAAIADQLKVKAEELAKLETLKEQREAQKQQEDGLKGILARMQDEAKELRAKIDGQKELLPLIEAEKQIREQMKGKEPTGQSAALAAQIREQAQRNAQLQADQEAQKKRDDLLKKQAEAQKDVDEYLDNQRRINEELQLRIKGEEDLIPLKRAEYELEKKIKDLTGEKQEEAKKQLAEILDAQKKYNEQLEEQKRTLEDILKGTGTYAEKLEKLKKAYADNRINAKQYNDAVRDLDFQHKKASDSAKSFADGVVGIFSRLITSGKDFGSTLKSIGIEIASLAAKKALLEPLANSLANIFRSMMGLPPVNTGTGGGAPGGGIGGGAGGFAGGLGGLLTGLLNPFSQTNGILRWLGGSLSGASATAAQGGNPLSYAASQIGKLMGFGPQAYGPGVGGGAFPLFSALQSLGGSFGNALGFGGQPGGGLGALGGIGNFLYQNTLGQLFSGFSGGLSGGIFGGLSGGAGGGFLSGLLKLIPGFASGGVASGKSPAWVGEDGAELIWPGRTTAVISNDDILRAMMSASGYGMANPFPQTDAEKFFGPNAFRLGSESASYQQMFDAVTMKPGGTPLYQQMGSAFQRDYSVFNSLDKAGDTGTQGWEVEQLLKKRSAYAAMTPDQQMRARMTGEGYFNNEDSARLFALINNQSLAVSTGLNRLYGEQLNAGVNAILNNDGFGPNLKSWAALTQGNKTFSALGAANNLMKAKLPDGNQLGNIVNRWSFAGVLPSEQVNSFSNTRDSIFDELEPYGGWQLQGYGYNSMGLGAGPGTGGETGAKATNWASYNQEWGSGIGYMQGWMGTGTPFSNNSLLQTGGNGVTQNIPGWQGFQYDPTRPSNQTKNNPPGMPGWERWDVLPSVYGSPQNASGGYWGRNTAQSGIPSWLQDAMRDPMWNGWGGTTGYASGGRPGTKNGVSIAERGRPEIFWPDTAGRITPLEQLLGGGGGGSIKIDNQSRSRLGIDSAYVDEEGNTVVRLKEEVAASMGTGGTIDKRLNSTYGVTRKPLRRG